MPKLGRPNPTPDANGFFPTAPHRGSPMMERNYLTFINVVYNRVARTTEVAHPTNFDHLSQQRAPQREAVKYTDLYSRWSSA